ncbi:MAG: hypothetical protein JWQ96_2640 [Segetibacter sp.]|jgi:hypothetical protein|nr:hypothetical protein [Segetibacter sp.]
MAQYFLYNDAKQYTFYEDNHKFHMPFPLMLKLKTYLRQVRVTSKTPIAEWLKSLPEEEWQKVAKVDLLNNSPA